MTFTSLRVTAAVALFSAVTLVVVKEAVGVPLDTQSHNVTAAANATASSTGAQSWCSAVPRCAEAQLTVQKFNDWFNDPAHGHAVVRVQAAIVPVATSAVVVAADDGTGLPKTSAVPWHLGLQVLPGPSICVAPTLSSGAPEEGAAVHRGEIYLKVNASLALSCRTFLAAAWLDPTPPQTPTTKSAGVTACATHQPDEEESTIGSTTIRLVGTLRRGLRRAVLGWISSHTSTGAAAASAERLLACDHALLSQGAQEGESVQSAEGCCTSPGCVTRNVDEIMSSLGEETQEWILALWLMFEAVVACAIGNNGHSLAAASFYCPYLNILPPPRHPPPTASSAIFFDDAELSSLAGTAVYHGVRMYRKRIERLRRWLSVDLAPTLDVTWKRDVTALRVTTEDAVVGGCSSSSSLGTIAQNEKMVAQPSATDHGDVPRRSAVCGPEWKHSAYPSRTCDSSPLRCENEEDDEKRSSGSGNLANALAVVETAWQSMLLPQQPWSEWALSVLWSRQVWWTESTPRSNDNQESSEPSRSAKGGRRKPEAHLAPMHDLANCMETPASTFQGGERRGPVVHRTQPSLDDPRFIETRALHAARAGEELFENYGETNSFYLLFHGFVLEHNAHDCAILLRPHGVEEDEEDHVGGGNHGSGRSRGFADRSAAPGRGGASVGGSDTSLVSELLTATVRSTLQKHGFASLLTTMNCLRVNDDREDEMPVDFVPSALDRWLTVLRAAYLIQRLDDEALEELLPQRLPSHGSKRMTLLRLSNFSRSVANAAGPTSDAVQYFSDPADSIEANEFVLAAARQYVARQRGLIASDKALLFHEERALRELAESTAAASDTNLSGRFASTVKSTHATSVWSTITRYVRQQRQQFVALERHILRLQKLVELQLHPSPKK